jgi:hypothetical protein
LGQSHLPDSDVAAERLAEPAVIIYTRRFQM